MALLNLEKHGDVFVLRMQNGENRFSTPFFGEFEEALRTIEASSGPAALVTIGEGKFYSNGIDLDWLTRESGDIPGFVTKLHGFLGRILAFPVPTVAALNGHAFAGGGMMALAHDFRVMRSDRGYFCLPEVDISIPFTVPLAELVRYKLPPAVAHRAMITGKRFTAEESLASGIVDEVAPEASVLERALALAGSLASKDRSTLGTIKKNAGSGVIAQLLGT